MNSNSYSAVDTWINNGTWIKNKNTMKKDTHKGKPLFIKLILAKKLKIF